MKKTLKFILTPFLFGLIFAYFALFVKQELKGFLLGSSIALTIQIIVLISMDSQDE